jgi:hypothetical protein
MNRDVLEQIAKTTVSSELYYDLCDNIDAMSDDELQALIACNGNYKKELKKSG